jgi:hypothetical protein
VHLQVTFLWRLTVSRDAFADEDRELRGLPPPRKFTPKSPEDYDAVVVHGEVYCVGCEPDGVTSPGLPIEAQQHWMSAPVCSKCEHVHTYMVIDPELRVLPEKKLAPKLGRGCPGCGMILCDCRSLSRDRYVQVDDEDPW